MDISQSRINISCPQCAGTLEVSLNQVQKEEAVSCPSCSSQVNLVDKDGGTRQGIRQINQGIDDLLGTIKKMSK